VTFDALANPPEVKTGAALPFLDLSVPFESVMVLKLKAGPLIMRVRHLLLLQFLCWAVWLPAHASRSRRRVWSRSAPLSASSRAAISMRSSGATGM